MHTILYLLLIFFGQHNFCFWRNSRQGVPWINEDDASSSNQHGGIDCALWHVDVLSANDD